MTPKPKKSKHVGAGFSFCHECACDGEYCDRDVAPNVTGHCDFFTHKASPPEHRSRIIRELLENPPF
jgi:hypothetical protein